MFLFCFGTRPEIIKLFPLIQEFKEYNIPFKILFTGQHKDLHKNFHNLIHKYDFELSVMVKGQPLNLLVANILTQTEPIFQNNKFTHIVVQGDTATSYALALSAFFHKTKIIHIEAGLRTYHKYQPFPEEINRRMISHIADIHFVPTELSKNNLLKENINHQHIHIVGNTIIDALRLMEIPSINSNKVIVTLHRRENRDKLGVLLDQINKISFQHKFKIIVVKHPSITNETYKKYLNDSIKIIDPLPYIDFLKLLAQSKFIISDSGGIQEECTYFKKKILICRNFTERPEVIDSGFGILVGDNIIDNIKWAMKPLHKYKNNPFGDGFASRKIINVLLNKDI
jgi:UDP-N-acetylglucosamine 2-epimerase (non-hydrolysing)